MAPALRSQPARRQSGRCSARYLSTNRVPINGRVVGCSRAWRSACAEVPGNTLAQRPMVHSMCESVLASCARPVASPKACAPRLSTRVRQAHVVDFDADQDAAGIRVVQRLPDRVGAEAGHPLRGGVGRNTHAALFAYAEQRLDQRSAGGHGGARPSKPAGVLGRW